MGLQDLINDKKSFRELFENKMDVKDIVFCVEWVLEKC